MKIRIIVVQIYANYNLNIGRIVFSRKMYIIMKRTDKTLKIEMGW